MQHGNVWTGEKLSIPVAAHYMGLTTVEVRYTLFFFFIRTSNLGAEAELSYIFLRFKAENVLKMFINYVVYTTCISVNQCGLAEIWYQELMIMANRDVCHHC